MKNVRCFISTRDRFTADDRWVRARQREESVLTGLYESGDESADQSTGLWGRVGGRLLLIVGVSISLWAIIIAAFVMVANAL